MCPVCVPHVPSVNTSTHNTSTREVQVRTYKYSIAQIAIRAKHATGDHHTHARKHRNRTTHARTHARTYALRIEARPDARPDRLDVPGPFSLSPDNLNDNLRGFSSHIDSLINADNLRAR